MPITVDVKLKQSQAANTLTEFHQLINETTSSSKLLNDALGNVQKSAKGVASELAKATKQANQLAASLSKSPRGASLSVARPSTVAGGLTRSLPASSRKGASQAQASPQSGSGSVATININAGNVNLKAKSGGGRSGSRSPGGSTNQNGPPLPNFAAMNAVKRTYGKRGLNSKMPTANQVFGISGKRPPDPFGHNPAAGAQYYRQRAAFGDPFAIKQFTKYHRQNQSLMRGQRLAQGGGDPVLQAIMRTRFVKSAFGGIKGMPLGIDIAKLLGSGNGAALSQIMGGGTGAAAGGAAALGVALGAATLAAFVFSVKEASEALRDWRKSLVIGGGNPGEARAASRMSEFLGVDIGGVGKNLISGYGPAAAIAAGVNPFGGPFGDNNYNRKGLKISDWVRNSSSLDQARRRAEMAGSPELANSYLLSDRTYKSMRSTEEGQGKMSALRDSAELDANIVILKDAFKDLFIMIGGPTIKKVAWTLSELAYATRWVTDTFDEVAEKIEKIFGIKTDDKAKDIKEAVRQGAYEGSSQGVKEGIYGGGQRAQRSIPSRLDPMTNPSYGSVPYGAL